MHLLVGKPLIQHVWERCQGCKELAKVVVATDDERIAEVVRGFGGEVVMTAVDHPSGTDRLAEAVANFPEATHVLNIQGDEPLIEPELVDELARAMKEEPALEMITAANVFEDEAALNDPNVVKVVLDVHGYALYFSRSPLPFQRNRESDLTLLRHKGIYGYRRDFLMKFVSWPPSVLERAESLEQLRALENGAKIRVQLTSDASIGLDTPEQVAQIEAMLRSL